MQDMRSGRRGAGSQSFLRNVGEVVLVAGEMVVGRLGARPGFKQEKPGREVLPALGILAASVRLHSDLTRVEIARDVVAPHGGDDAATDLDSVLGDEGDRA